MKHTVRSFLTKAYSVAAWLMFPSRPFSVSETAAFGFRLFFYADQRTGQRIRLGRFEPEESEFLCRELKDGDVCLDVGANVGYYTMMFATRAREVIAVEPLPINADLLQLSATINGLKNIRIVRAVCGQAAGEVEFLQTKQTGHSSVVFLDRERNQEDHIAAGHRLRVVCIDEMELSQLDIVKVDVEGYEYECVKGMLETLKSRRPRIVMIELVDRHLKRFGHEVEDVVELFRSAGYAPVGLNGASAASPVLSRTRNDNVFFAPLASPVENGW